MANTLYYSCPNGLPWAGAVKSFTVPNNGSFTVKTLSELGWGSNSGSSTGSNTYYYTLVNWNGSQVAQYNATWTGTTTWTTTYSTSKWWGSDGLALSFAPGNTYAWNTYIGANYTEWFLYTGGTFITSNTTYSSSGVSRTAGTPSFTFPAQDTRTGYNKLGWDNGAGTYYAAGATYTTNAWSATFRSAYQAKTYTVTLNQGSGSGGTSSVTATYDQSMPSATMPTWSGHTFIGYFSDSGVRYYNADGSSARNWDIDGNTTLYARYVDYVVKPYTEGQVWIKDGNTWKKGTSWIKDESGNWVYGTTHFVTG